jgi:hypothetical protein
MTCTRAAQDIILALRVRLLDRQDQGLSPQRKMRTATPPEAGTSSMKARSSPCLKKRMQEGWDAAQPILELDH